MLLFFNLTFLSRILNHDLFISEIFLKFTYSCNFSEKLSICVKKLFVVVVSVGKSQIDKLSNRWRACEEKRKKCTLGIAWGQVWEDQIEVRPNEECTRWCSSPSLLSRSERLCVVVISSSTTLPSPRVFVNGKYCVVNYYTVGFGTFGLYYLFLIVSLSSLVGNGILQLSFFYLLFKQLVYHASPSSLSVVEDEEGSTSSRSTMAINILIL